MSLSNYLLNLLTLARGRTTLRPLVAIFHLTGRCNLNCAYCEDYGARRPDDSLAGLGVLPLAEARRVLTLLRQAAPHLILTGGEPLLYPDIDALADAAKNEFRFKSVTLLTNGLLLPKHPALLSRLNRLVISLDALDAVRWGETLGVGSGAAQSIINTVEQMATAQQRHHFRLIVNCVVTPQTLPDALAVLNFCTERDIAFAFSPQSFNNWPHYDLLVSREYPAFVDEVIARKRRGAKILGSLAYLRKMRAFEPFNCYPTLAPRVLPSGELIYPCRPIERGGTPHGGRPCNLTAVASWAEAITAAETQYGPPPKSCVSCFQQCYAEPSLMQAQPLSLAGEMLRFSASRRLRLTTFAPG